MKTNGQSPSLLIVLNRRCCRPTADTALQPSHALQRCERGKLVSKKCVRRDEGTLYTVQRLLSLI